MSLILSVLGAQITLPKVSFPNVTVNLYTVAANPETGEPAKDEYEVVLRKKPANNTINIPFTATNLVFYYQPPLTSEFAQAECEIWTETHVKLLDGKEYFRPANIVGSYAVYHASKVGNEAGTGKLFHIYRPYATDALGAMVWCSIHIANNILTMTIPQTFLNSATYPVTVT